MKSDPTKIFSAVLEIYNFAINNNKIIIKIVIFAIPKW